MALMAERIKTVSVFPCPATFSLLSTPVPPTSLRAADQHHCERVRRDVERVRRGGSGDTRGGDKRHLAWVQLHAGGHGCQLDRQQSEHKVLSRRVWPCVRWRLWSVLPHLYPGGCFCPRCRSLDVITLAVSAGRALRCRVVRTVGVLRALEWLRYAGVC